MHRSGTSALAGVLHHLGVGLGESLMPGNQNDNPKGFFENEKIVQVHQSLLHGLGYAWHDVRLLPDDWLTRKHVREKKNAIIEIIKTEFFGYQIWAIKDPRMCRLLPLWKEIFCELGLKTVYIHMFRDPLEVAMSLKRRDGFVNAYSTLLWLLHHVEAVQNTRDEPRVFLGYEELLRDWRGAIQKIGKTLEVRWPKKTTRAAPEIDRFLSLDLYHNKSDVEPLVDSEDFCQPITTFYKLLCEAAATRVLASPTQFEDFSQRYTDVVKLLKPWLSLLPKELSTERVTQIQGLDATLTEAQHLAGKRNETIALLEPALEDAQRIVRQQNDKIGFLERAIEESQQSMARLFMEVDQKVDLLEKKLEETKQLAIERIGRIGVLDAALIEAQQLVEERNKFIGLLEPALDEAQQIVQVQNKKIENLDTGLKEAQRLVEERNNYVGLLEPALEEAQRIVHQQNDRMKDMADRRLWSPGELINIIAKMRK